MVSFVMLLVALLLAGLVGVTLALLGGGGAILTVPIFAYALGYDPKLAVAMSLPVVGAASFLGALGHWRAKNVDLRIATMFGAVSMVGAYGGAWIGARMAGRAQLLLLAFVMLAAAVAMFYRDTQASAHADSVPPRAHVHPVLIGSAALAVGVLTGMLGIGGGFLVVPALTQLVGVPMRRAIGTSLVVIVMSSAAGALGYLGHVDMPWRFMSLFIAAAGCGTVLGRRLGLLVSTRTLARTFAIFLVLLGSFMLFRNRSVLTGGEVLGSILSYHVVSSA